MKTKNLLQQQFMSGIQDSCFQKMAGVDIAHLGHFDLVHTLQPKEAPEETPIVGFERTD